MHLFANSVLFWNFEWLSADGNLSQVDHLRTRRAPPLIKAIDL